MALTMILGATASTSITDVGATLNSIDEIGKKHTLEILALDASRIHGKEHLAIALEKAERAFAQGRNISNTMTTEIMVYAAAERQISRSLEKLGIKPGIDKLAVVIIGQQDNAELNPETILSELGWQRDDSALEPANPGETEKIIEQMALSELER